MHMSDILKVAQERGDEVHKILSAHSDDILSFRLKVSYITGHVEPITVVQATVCHCLLPLSKNQPAINCSTICSGAITVGKSIEEAGFLRETITEDVEETMSPQRRESLTDTQILHRAAGIVRFLLSGSRQWHIVA